MAGFDIDAKMSEFAALGSKAKMVEFIVSLNENIISFKNKVRKSGNVAALTAGYRAHLERIAPGGQRNKSDSHAKTKQRTTATDTDEDASQEVGEPSQPRNKGKQRATTADVGGHTPQQAAGLLSRLMIVPNPPISAITQQCLQALGSSLDTHLRHPDDDDLAVLQPLYHAILEVVSARSVIPLSYNHGENYEKLSMAISRIDPIEVSTTTLVPFMTAMGIKCSGPEIEDDTDTEITAALNKEIDIIWNEYNAALDRWSYTFPEPSAENISYPLNFTEKEKVTLRKFARDFIKAQPHLASKAVDPADLQGAFQTLKDNWPISKGKVTAIVQLVLDEARREFTRSESRSRSRKPKGKDVGGDEDDGNEDNNSDDEENGATGKGKGKGKAKGKLKEKEEQGKRKRPVVVESDDSDGASSFSKTSRTERGGAERGRTFARRYHSPSKRGAGRG